MSSGIVIENLCYNVEFWDEYVEHMVVGFLSFLLFLCGVVCGIYGGPVLVVLFEFALFDVLC